MYSNKNRMSSAAQLHHGILDSHSIYISIHRIWIIPGNWTTMGRICNNSYPYIYIEINFHTHNSGTGKQSTHIKFCCSSLEVSKTQWTNDDERFVIRWYRRIHKVSGSILIAVTKLKIKIKYSSILITSHQKMRVELTNETSRFSNISEKTGNTQDNIYWWVTMNCVCYQQHCIVYGR
jgi:hypothetical protein